MSGTVPVSLPIPSSIPSPWIRKEGSRLASSVAKANGVTRPSTASWNSSATLSASSRSTEEPSPRVDAAGSRDGRRRAGPSGGDGDVGERAAEVGLVAAGVGGVVDGIGADQIDEGLADADQRALAGGCHRPRIGSRRWRATIIERTVEIDGIGVFLREVEGEGDADRLRPRQPDQLGRLVAVPGAGRGPGDRVRPAGLGPLGATRSARVRRHLRRPREPGREAPGSGRAGRLPPRRPRLGRDRADPRSATPREGATAGDHARGAVPARVSVALDRADLATSRPRRALQRDGVEGRHGADPAAGPGGPPAVAARVRRHDLGADGSGDEAGDPRALPLR